MVKYHLICMANVTTFLFFIFRIPNFPRIISSSVFYGTVISEILRIARSSSSILIIDDESSTLITRMEKQGENRGTLIEQIMKAYENHQLVFQKYDVSNKDVLKTPQ